MNITNAQLSTMSNFELGKLLMTLLSWQVHAFEFEGVVTITKENKTTTFDILCWEDLMPLAIDYDISYIKELKTAFGKPCISKGELLSEFEFADEIPQRAYAGCLILSLQDRR